MKYTCNDCHFSGDEYDFASGSPTMEAPQCPECFSIEVNISKAQPAEFVAANEFVRAAIALREAANAMLIDANDRDEVIDEETGEEYDDWKALREALEAFDAITPGSKPRTCEPPKIVVSVSGGAVTAVYCNDDKATAEIVDFDDLRADAKNDGECDQALDAATDGMACIW